MLILQETEQEVSFLNAKELQNIKACLLKTPGPVSTYVACRDSGPRQLRKLPKEVYEYACYSLESDDLAEVISVVVTGRMVMVLIKKPPDEVEDILQMNPDLCTVEEYSKKFKLLPPVNIKKTIRRELIARGYVTEAQMAYHAKKETKKQTFVVVTEEEM